MLADDRRMLTREAPIHREAPMENPSPLVGQILRFDRAEAADAEQRLSGHLLELVRALPSGGVHRMPIEYDRTIRRVPAEVDYGVLSGDRLIVTEDTGNMFSDMGDSVGDLFMNKPKSGKTKNGTFRIAG